METESIKRVCLVINNTDVRNPYKTLRSISTVALLNYRTVEKPSTVFPATIDRSRAEKSTNRFSVFQRPSATRHNQYIGRQSLPGLIFSFVAASSVVTSFSGGPGKRSDRQTGAAFEIRYRGHRGTLIDVLINQRPVSRARGGADRGD